MTEYTIAYQSPQITGVMPRFEGFGDTTMGSEGTEDSEVAMSDMTGKNV